MHKVSAICLAFLIAQLPAFSRHTTVPHAYDLTFVYDSEGRHTKKHVIECKDGAIISEKTITYLWDGWDLLYERHQLPSGLTTLERTYLWDPDIADGAAGLPAIASATAGGAGGIEPTRQPIAEDMPTYLKIEVHSASRLRTSFSKIRAACGWQGYSHYSPLVANHRASRFWH